MLASVCPLKMSALQNATLIFTMGLTGNYPNPIYFLANQSSKK